jgi:hypothetical protein
MLQLIRKTQEKSLNLHSDSNPKFPRLLQTKEGLTLNLEFHYRNKKKLFLKIFDLNVIISEKNSKQSLNP